RCQRISICTYRVLHLTVIFFFFNDTATTEIYTLSLHDALPISGAGRRRGVRNRIAAARTGRRGDRHGGRGDVGALAEVGAPWRCGRGGRGHRRSAGEDGSVPSVPEPCAEQGLGDGTPGGGRRADEPLCGGRGATTYRLGGVARRRCPRCGAPGVREGIRQDRRDAMTNC